MTVWNDSKATQSLESTHGTAGNGGKVLRVYSKCFGLQHKSHKRPFMEMASLKLYCDMREEFESDGSCKEPAPPKRIQPNSETHMLRALTSRSLVGNQTKDRGQ